MSAVEPVPATTEEAIAGGVLSLPERGQELFATIAGAEMVLKAARQQQREAVRAALPLVEVVRLLLETGRADSNSEALVAEATELIREALKASALVALRSAAAEGEKAGLAIKTAEVDI